MEISPEHAELLRRLDDIACDLRNTAMQAAFVHATAANIQAGKDPVAAEAAALDLVRRAETAYAGVLRTHADLRATDPRTSE